MKDYQEKKEELIKKINQYTKEDIIIAFSGGVDSSLLLKLACNSAKLTGKKVHAVTITSELQPANDINIAKKVVEEIGGIHHIINVNEFDNPEITSNPKNRCYICKKILFTKILNLAKELKVNIIMEGTNEDDLHVYRPGIKAINELGILSPLAEGKIRKEEVRRMADEYGISVAKRPSTPCLATRFPYGTFINKDKLIKVEKGEKYIKSFGFNNVRLRVHEDIARIEVDSGDMPKLINHYKDIVINLKKIGYKYITLDLEGFRSGSMDL